MRTEKDDHNDTGTYRNYIGPARDRKNNHRANIGRNSTYKKAAHIEVDDFWQFIRQGYIHPWLGGGGSGNQNDTVIEAVAASAKIYSTGGYEVFVAGTISPWFIEPWRKIAQKGVDVRYIVLRPSKEITVTRATRRAQRDFFPLSVENVEDVWDSFADVGIYEPHVVDTTGQTAVESAEAIKSMIKDGYFRVE